MATVSQQLRVVKLNIDWGMPQSEKQAPATLPLSPSLITHHLASTSWYQPSQQTDSFISSAMTQLSHLEIFPSTMDQAGQSWAPPLILAVRSYLPSPESPFQEVQSIIDRWQILTDQRQSIHPAFSALGVQRPAQDLQPVTRLQKGEPIVFNKIVVGIQHVQFGKVVGIFFADGSVEYRDRITMEEIYNEENLDRVSNLQQVGFSFANPSPCKSRGPFRLITTFVHVSMTNNVLGLESIFSPTGCSLIQVTSDGSLAWRPLRHSQGIPEETNQDGMNKHPTAADVRYLD